MLRLLYFGLKVILYMLATASLPDIYSIRNFMPGLSLKTARRSNVNFKEKATIFRDIAIVYK